MCTGNVAIEEASGLSLNFVGGRTDADQYAELPFPDHFELRLNGGDQDDTSEILKDTMKIWGFTMREMVALIGGGHSLGRMHQDRSGFVSGAWTTNPNVFDNELFVNLVTLDWKKMNPTSDFVQYSATTNDNKVVYMLRTDMLMLIDAEYEAIVQEFAADSEAFLEEFVNAWYKITTADMFWLDRTDAGKSSTSDGDDDGLSEDIIILISVLGGALVGAFLMAAVFCCMLRFQPFKGRGAKGQDTENPMQSL